MCLGGIVKVDGLGLRRLFCPFFFMFIFGFIEKISSFSSSSLDSNTWKVGSIGN